MLDQAETCINVCLCVHVTGAKYTRVQKLLENVDCLRKLVKNSLGSWFQTTQDKLVKNRMAFVVLCQDSNGTKNRTKTFMLNWDSSVTQEQKLQAWNLNDQQHLQLSAGSLSVSRTAAPPPRPSSCPSCRFQNSGPRNPLKTHPGSRSSSHGATSCLTLFKP